MEALPVTPDREADETPLLAAVRRGTHAEVVHALRVLPPEEAAAVVDHRDAYGYTALVWAALHGQGDDVATLLLAGADAELCSSRGTTALMGAAEKGYEDVAAALLAHGADVDAQSPLGMQQTALMVAAAHGHEEMTRLLLAHGAALDCVDRAGCTALTLAGSDPVLALLQQASSQALWLHLTTTPEDGQNLIALRNTPSAASLPSLSSGGSDRTHSTRDSTLSRRSRRSRASRSSAESSRLVSSRNDSTNSLVSLKRRDTDEWLQAIAALTEPATPGPTPGPCKDRERGRGGLDLIPGTPLGAREDDSPLKPTTTSQDTSPAEDTGTTQAASSTGDDDDSCSSWAALLEVDPALLHGVWVLKRRATQRLYHSRLAWIEIGPRGRKGQQAFLCWSKDGFRSNCKRLPLAEVAAVEGPSFEGAGGLGSEEQRGRSRTLSSGSLSNAGRRAGMGPSGATGSSQAAGRGWRWLRRAAPPVDGLVLQIRCKVAPALVLKFDEAAPLSPYDWRSALMAAKHFESAPL